ncbi:MAG: hypothetical protein WC551_10065 [Patescibacteria group bacterium]
MGQTVVNGVQLRPKTAQYARGVQPVVLEDREDMLVLRLENTCSYASAVEDGTSSPTDLKKSIRNSSKARKAKDGHLYLIVPFRHGLGKNTQGFTPASPAARRYWRGMAKKIADREGVDVRTVIIGKRRELRVGGGDSNAGKWVFRPVYKWGARYNPDTRGLSGEALSQASRERGMVLTGKKGHSSALTFRTMSERGNGWIVPARPGAHVGAHLTRIAQREIPRQIEKALWADMAAIYDYYREAEKQEGYRGN